MVSSARTAAARPLVPAVVRLPRPRRAAWRPGRRGDQVEAHGDAGDGGDRAQPGQGPWEAAVDGPGDGNQAAEHEDQAEDDGEVIGDPELAVGDGVGDAFGVAGGVAGWRRLPTSPTGRRRCRLSTPSGGSIPQPWAGLPSRLASVRLGAHGVGLTGQEDQRHEHGHRQQGGLVVASWVLGVEAASGEGCRPAGIGPTCPPRRARSRRFPARGCLGRVASQTGDQSVGCRLLV
jgi:hypothetical protein